MIEAIDVNPEMAYQFILELKKKRVEFIVAPYEADVQLAYLARIKYVDFVITEDSDLIALGCKNILFKLDLDTAYGYELRYENIQKCSKYDFTRYDEDKFLQFCILSGCDYFKLKGVGCKKAYNVMKEKSNYKENIEILRRLHNNDISQQDLVEKFEKAFLTFKYQVIYCPIEKATRYSNDVLNSPYNFLSQYNQLDFLGK